MPIQCRRTADHYPGMLIFIRLRETGYDNGEHHS